MNLVCLFCLEEIQGNPTSNPIGCRCKIQAHESCFHHWFEQKQSYECPICHTVSVPTPIHHENIRIVVIERQQAREERNNRTNQKAVAVCCCLLIGWSVGLTILDAIYASMRS